jgi:hypothetical protein
MANEITYNTRGERIEKIKEPTFHFTPQDNQYNLKFAHYAAMGGLLIKHSAYNFEKGFRVLCDTFFLSDCKKLEENISDKLVVPLCSNFFDSVIVYPGASDNVCNTVKNILDKYGFSCLVKKSTLDRNW